jgi:hypothetical protein
MLESKNMKLCSYILCVHLLLQSYGKYYICQVFCYVLRFGKLIDKFKVSSYPMMINVPTKTVVEHVTI